MEIHYLLIPMSIVLVFIIGALFWWSLKHGQFEDMEGPGYRILMDDDRPATVGAAGQAGQENSGEKDGMQRDATKTVRRLDPGQ
jgi:cbb3-type cytochrome oxidase maturation protein